MEWHVCPRCGTYTPLQCQCDRRRSIELRDHPLPLDPELVAKWQSEYRLHWAELFLDSSIDIEAWAERIPAHSCKCVAEFENYSRENPFDGSFQWKWAFKNHVNGKLGKPPMGLEEAELLWLAQFKPTSDRLLITVATEPMHELLKVTRPLMEQYARRCGADFIALTNQTHSFWGMEKFRIEKYGSQYERCLFLDADVIVRPGAPNLFDRKGVWIHNDLPWLQNTSWIEPEKRAVAESQRVEAWPLDDLLNSGVVLTDDPRVWRRPSDALPTTHCAEQFWVEFNIKSHASTYHHLETEFNTQWWMREFREIVDRAWFIHLANCPDRVSEARSVAKRARN